MEQQTVASSEAVSEQTVILDIAEAKESPGKESLPVKPLEVVVGSSRATDVVGTVVVAADNDDEADANVRMAPALTEPTAVPTAAKNSDASTSPQPEIFISSPSSIVSNSSEATEPVALSVSGQQKSNNNSIDNKIDESIGDGLGSKKSGGNKKKEDFQFKELRSNRRRSQIVAKNSKTETVVREGTETTTNGKSFQATPRSKPNGLKGSTTQKSMKDEDEEKQEFRLENELVAEATDELGVVAGTNSLVEGEQFREEEGQPSEATTAEQEISAQQLAASSNDEQKVEMSPKELLGGGEGATPAAAGGTDGDVMNDEVAIGSIPSSGVEEKPVVVAKEMESGGGGEFVEHLLLVDQQHQQPPPPPIEGSVLNVESDKSNVLMMDLEIAANYLQLQSDALAKGVKPIHEADTQKLLDELVLATPTNKLAEQLCSLVKDQQQELEKQEQQQNLVTSTSSTTLQAATTTTAMVNDDLSASPFTIPTTPSPTKSLNQSLSQPDAAANAAEVEDMLGDMDLLQVFKSFEANTTAGQTDRTLLSLLEDDDDDVDMLVSSTSQGPSIVGSLGSVSRNNIVVSSDKSSVIAATKLGGEGGLGAAAGTQSDCHKMDHHQQKQLQQQQLDVDEDEEERMERLDFVARKEALAEIEKIRSQLYRKADFLLRRLRKVQIHQLGQQTSEEVVELFGRAAAAHRTTAAVSGMKAGSCGGYEKRKYLKQTVIKKDDPLMDINNVSMQSVNRRLPSPSSGGNVVIRPASPPFPAIQATDLGHTSTPIPGSLLKKSPNSVSPATMRTFVKQRTTPATASSLAGLMSGGGSGGGGPYRTALQQHQQIKATSVNLLNNMNNNNNDNINSSRSNNNMISNTNNNNKNTSNYNVINSVSDHNNKGGLSGAASCNVTGGGKLNDLQSGQLARTAGLLKTELRIVEQAIDSEATASSSGGESADELLNYTNSHQATLEM